MREILRQTEIRRHREVGKQRKRDRYSTQREIYIQKDRQIWMTDWLADGVVCLPKNVTSPSFGDAINQSDGQSS